MVAGARVRKSYAVTQWREGWIKGLSVAPSLVKHLSYPIIWHQLTRETRGETVVQIARQLQRSGLLILVLTAAAAAAASCSAGGGNNPGGNLNGSGGSSSGGLGAGGLGLGGIPVVNVGGASGASSITIKKDLPQPWLYYIEGNDYAYKDPTANAGIRNAFQGTVDPTKHPVLVYPLDHSMHPMNLGQIDFQWQKGDSSELAYRIDATDGTKNYHFYVPCVKALNACHYPMPESEILHLGLDYAGKQLTWSITGTDAAGHLFQSSTIQLFYTPAEVDGALYYWASSKAEIKRAAFGARQAVPLIDPNSTTNDYACSACHSVSRKGNVIGFSVCNKAGENVAGIRIAPTDDPTNPYFKPTMGTTPFGPNLSHTPPADTIGSTTGQPTDHFGTSLGLNPDGTIAAVNGINVNSPNDGWKPWLALWDAHTGAVLDGPYYAGDPIFGGGNQLGIWPEYSADGSQLVVQVVGGPATNAVWAFSGNGSGIGIMPVTGNKLGTTRMVVPPPATGFHFYPSISPDSQWIAFASAVTATDSKGRNMSNQFDSAVLRLANVTSGQVTELVRGTQYTVADAQAMAAGTKLPAGHSTWPKFAPFAQGPNKNLMFITYTSAMPYGTILPQGGLTQLWLFAVDVSKIGTDDPSYAPIWIPYQDPTDASLSPYWTEVIPCYAQAGGVCSGCVAGETCFVSTDNTCSCRNENVTH